MRIILLKSFLLLTAFVILFGLGFPLLSLSGEKQGKALFNEEIKLPFALKAETKVAILYLGYVGCQSICMPSLSESAELFRELNSSEVAFYFVNVSKEGVGAAEFAAHFHEDFQGLQLTQQEITALSRSLRAYSSEPLSLGGDIYHTGYLYLISHKRGKTWLKAMYYTRPFDKASIISDIQKELK